MEMEKTAMEQLIAELKRKYSIAKQSYDYLAVERMGAYISIIDKAESLLETEKKQIVEAYTTAQKEIVQIIVDNHGADYFPKTIKQFEDITNGEDNEDAEEYFNNKFKK